MREPCLGSRALRVLVVDDGPASTDALAGALRHAGFETCEVRPGDAHRALEAFRPDLVVFGVPLVGPEGRELEPDRSDGRDEHAARTHGAAWPAVGDGDGVAGQKLALDTGSKRRDGAELVARVIRLLRRTTDEGEEQSVLRFADVVLNDQTHEVARRGAPVQLSPTEFNLLRFFLLNPGLVLSKRQILDNVWRDDFSGDPRVVETYVSYLRKKLDRLGPPLIHTIRLVGYALRQPQAL